MTSVPWSAPADPPLAEGAIAAWVQPIVALTTGAVSGYEALARFRDRRGDVADVFERAWTLGEGPALEARALCAALELTGRPESAYLAVNVSPRAMQVDFVRDVLDTDLTGLVVELTEAHYMPTSELRRIADWLRARGAGLAIDDLGTGYAGLERLITVRPDLIKLDRTLVSQLLDDGVSRVMVESLVRFAARIDASIVAEGIEDERLLELVAELDIAYGQGFLFGTAQPAWATPSERAVAAAQKVHQQALGGTPRQSLFLDELIVLERIADRFNEADALVDVQHAVAALTSLVAADDVSIGLVDEDANQLVSVSHHTWVDVGELQDMDEHPLLRWVIDTRRAAQVLAGDTLADPAQLARLHQTGYGGVLLVPIITRGVAIGLLSLYRSTPEPWTLAEIRYARIGVSHLAAALDRLVSREPGRGAR